MYRTVLLTIHIASVAAWLGCNFTQLFLGPWFARRGGDAALAWFEASALLARRYYNAAGVLLGLTGVLLVREVGYDWSAGFIAVGITVIVIGAALGVLLFAPGGDRLAAAQREGDAGRVKALATRYTFAAAVDTTLVLVAVLAMVHRWRA